MRCRSEPLRRRRTLVTRAAEAGAILGLASGCGPAPERGGTAVAAPQQPVAAQPSASATASARSGAVPEGASCALARPEIRDVSLREIRRVGFLADRSWLVSKGSRGRWKLTTIGSDGRLAHTALPLQPNYAAVQSPTTFRFLFTGDSPRGKRPKGEQRWWTVDVSEPERPRATKPTRVQGLEPWEHVRGLTTDGTRALITMARTPPTGGDPQDATALFDLSSGTRTSELAPLAVAKAACRQGRCYGLAPSPTQQRAPVIVRFADAGHTTLRELEPTECPHGYVGFTDVPTWRQGARWSLAFAVEDEVRLLSVELDSGAVTLTPLSPKMGRCPRLHAARLDGRDGLVIVGAGRAAFYPENEQGQLRPPEPLPPIQHHSCQLIPLGRGALLLDYENATSLAGAPSAGGQVHWHVWSFKGEAGLLQPEGTGAWQRADVVKLPHHGEAGQHGQGFELFGLTRPGHAMVIMERQDTFGSSHAVVLRRPCGG